MATKAKAKKRKRSVVAEACNGIYPMLERVTTTRSKLTPEAARGFYVLARCIADEHDHARQSLLERMPKGTDIGLERVEFHRHASSALRMVAERVLKSWDTFRLLAFEKTVTDDFRAAIGRLSREHVKKSHTPDEEVDGGEYQ